MSPTEVLKLSEFDISLILEGIAHEFKLRSGKDDENDQKIDIFNMSNDELEKLKKQMLEGSKGVGNNVKSIRRPRT